MGIKKSRLETEEQFRARKDELIKMCKDSLLSQWTEELQSEFEDNVMKERWLHAGKLWMKDGWTQERQDAFEREMEDMGRGVEIPQIDKDYRNSYYHGFTLGIRVRPEHLKEILAEMHEWVNYPKEIFESSPGEKYLSGIHKLQKETA